MQSYNSSDLAQNVTDTADVKRRCDAAGGELKDITTMGNARGNRSIWNYCMLENAGKVPALIGNLTGAGRANVLCSTQTYKGSSGMKVNRVGKAFLAVMVISGAALALVGI